MRNAVLCPLDWFLSLSSPDPTSREEALGLLKVGVDLSVVPDTFLLGAKVFCLSRTRAEPEGTPVWVGSRLCPSSCVT